KDGMLEGPDITGIKKMALQTGLEVIASGGISSIEDIKAVKHLEESGVVGIISGKAIYEGRISVKEACELLLN
ncbi:MAG: 1-(5-phosphoribosyl)-5-((5-phosphoribosylamino)methylideneamino)imidazole-4-carboxamide isomerase, partial [Spirochaetes bacterium]|nr:1-(5-phosphoribosyl)-5-((5-phosphoribosylamino)methylideneamino)imidazole-4-carboxamide isomerase [Spirochaetota bacterium]